MSEKIIEDQLNDLENLCAELKELPTEDTLTEARSALTQIKISLSGEKMKPIKSSCALKLKLMETQLQDTERALLMGNHHSTKQLKPAESNLDRLSKSLDLLRESESVAENTLMNLKAQRDTLRSAKSKLDETSRDLKKSKTILHRMESWWK